MNHNPSSVHVQELKSAAVRKRMQAVAQKNNRGEIQLRRALHAKGLRFRLHRKIPFSRRTIDLAFVKAKVAVFVDGCFWHYCPQHGTMPKSNMDWWKEKLLGNVERDRDTDVRLLQCGWLPLRIWEHENAAEAAARIERTVRSRLRR